ncbi:MAG: hypothetical protein MUC91_11625, partial [Verrucomicrobia bacterium]|nr:hypothetical protein [Verrucomicrobiota bacterium]
PDLGLISGFCQSSACGAGEPRSRIGRVDAQINAVEGSIRLTSFRAVRNPALYHREDELSAVPVRDPD